MYPDDIIKAAPAIAKGVGAIAAAIPFTAIVKRMLGPAADELAEMWKDQVRMYRYKRQTECVAKAGKMLHDAKLKPQPVPPKILFPLLEGASLEDNEDLHTMWAALLANAASPNKEPKLRPGFIAILRQLAPEEAVVLRWIYDGGGERYVGLRLYYEGELFANLSAPVFRECLDALEAAGLIRLSPLKTYIEDGFSSATGPSMLLTYRGEAFIAACKSPEK